MLSHKQVQSSDAAHEHTPRQERNKTRLSNCQHLLAVDYTLMMIYMLYCHEDVTAFEMRALTSSHRLYYSDPADDQE